MNGRGRRTSRKQVYAGTEGSSFQDVGAEEGMIRRRLVGMTEVTVERLMTVG